jgi:hypothetical protein
MESSVPTSFVSRSVKLFGAISIFIGSMAKFSQTYSYSRHFTSTCVRVCGYETNTRGIDVEGHVAAITHCPVGVDAERVARDT